MKIGMLIIAVGKYDRFVRQLKEGIDKYFLPDHEKVYYLFSDHGIGFPVPSVKWPYPTLWRYKWFTEYADQIDAEVLYYIDVDMSIVNVVGDEILPDETGLVAVKHPGFWNGGWGDHETTRDSFAYVPMNMRKQYYAGGFQGGERNKYLEIAKKLAWQIDDDHKTGIIAKWHDESHWNYCLSFTPHKELDPSYCYPQAPWAKNLPFDKKIIALDKNHKELRK